MTGALALAPDDTLPAEFAAFLTVECGYRDVRPIGDRMYACLYPLSFTCAIITGRIKDRSGYEDRWCYHSYDAAEAALDAWDDEGEPTGWHRHPGTGRRRPDGDASREEVRW